MTDGVLNCARSQSRAPFYDGAGTWYVGLDSNKLRNLAKIIQETDAKIVLTTTWREHYEVGAYKQTDPVGKYINNKFQYDLNFGISLLGNEQRQEITDKKYKEAKNKYFYYKRFYFYRANGQDVVC